MRSSVNAVMPRSDLLPDGGLVGILGRRGADERVGGIVDDTRGGGFGRARNRICGELVDKLGGKHE